MLNGLDEIEEMMTPDHSGVAKGYEGVSASARRRIYAKKQRQGVEQKLKAGKARSLKSDRSIVPIRRFSWEDNG